MTIQQDWESLEAREVTGIAGIARGAVPILSVRAMPAGKRLFDIAFSLLLLIPLSVVMGVVAVLLLIRQGRLTEAIAVIPDVATQRKEKRHLWTER